MTKTEIREKLSPIADKVTFHKDGTISACREYFYRHGATAEALAEEIKRALPGSDVVSAEDRFSSWPKTSFFRVVFKAAA